MAKTGLSKVFSYTPHNGSFRLKEPATTHQAVSFVAEDQSQLVEFPCRPLVGPFRKGWERLNGHFAKPWAEAGFSERGKPENRPLIEVWCKKLLVDTRNQV